MAVVMDVFVRFRTRFSPRPRFASIENDPREKHRVFTYLTGKKIGSERFRRILPRKAEEVKNFLHEVGLDVGLPETIKRCSTGREKST